MIEAVERRRRIDRQPCFATVLVNEPDGAIDVRGRLRMKADDGSAGTCTPLEAANETSLVRGI